MQILTVLSAVLAVALAKPGYLAGPVAAPAVAVVGSDAANVAAQNAFARAQGAAAAADGVAAAAAGDALFAGPVAVAAGPAVVAAPYAAVHGYHLPVLTPGGVPVDTPAVQVARASHAVAHANAAAAAAVAPAAAVVAAAPYAALHGYHVPVITPGGVPIDTPAVQAARASHAVAHANAAAAAAAAPAVIAGPGLYYGGHGGYHVPVLTPAGVPVDTPEVQAARAADAVAHINAKAAALG